MPDQVGAYLVDGRHQRRQERRRARAPASRERAARRPGDGDRADAELPGDPGSARRDHRARRRLLGGRGADAHDRRRRACAGRERPGRSSRLPATGVYHLVATATDLDGFTSTTTSTLRVRDPLDQAAPQVRFDPGVGGSRITGTFVIGGSIVDSNLESWTLEIARSGDTHFETLAQGSGPVTRDARHARPVALRAELLRAAPHRHGHRRPERRGDDRRRARPGGVRRPLRPHRHRLHGDRRRRDAGVHAELRLVQRVRHGQLRRGVDARLARPAPRHRRTRDRIGSLGRLQRAARRLAGDRRHTRRRPGRIHVRARADHRRGLHVLPARSGSPIRASRGGSTRRRSRCSAPAGSSTRSTTAARTTRPRSIGNRAQYTLADVRRDALGVQRGRRRFLDHVHGRRRAPGQRQRRRRPRERRDQLHERSRRAADAA